MAAWLARRPARPLLVDGNIGSIDLVFNNLLFLDKIYIVPVATRNFACGRTEYFFMGIAGRINS